MSPLFAGHHHPYKAEPLTVIYYAPNQAPSHSNETGGLCGFSPSLLCMYSLCLYACIYVHVCGSQRFQVSLKQFLTEP